MFPETTMSSKASSNMVNTTSGFEKEKKKKGKWSAFEDQILNDYVSKHGPGKWGKIAKQIGLGRCGKSVRLRWLNYLRPDIKLGNIREDEEDLIIRMHKLVGSRWSLIAGRIPGRTDNEIKNYWISTLSKKLEKQKRKAEITKGKEIEKNLKTSPAEVDEGHPPQLTKCNEAPRGEGLVFHHPNQHHCSDADNNTSNFWIMDLDESQLDMSKFLQTAQFSNFWEESELFMNFEVGGCSTIYHESPTNFWGA